MSVSGSQYDVVVKLSTLGNDQLSSNLKNVQGVATAMAASLNNADSGTKRLSASFRQSDADGNKFAVTMRDLGTASGKYVPLVNQLSGALVKVAAAWAALSVVRDVVGEIFSATKHQEDMVTTVAATMTATNSWSTSIGVAEEQLKKLKETAALVNSTEDQMVGTFTMLKRVFGGTSEEAVTLTGKLALLSRQSGASVDELSTRLAAASISGKMQIRGPAGIALVGAGVDPQVLVTMKEAGLAMEYLNATIADNPGLVERLMNGWSYLTAEFKKNKEEALETIGQGLEPLKKALSELNTAISSDESQAGFTKLGANLANLTEQLKGLFSPGGMQDSVHWYTGFLNKTIAFFSTLLLIWKTGLDTMGNVAAAGWDVITHPMKYIGAGGGHAMKAELTRILDEELAIVKGAAAKAKKIWKTAMSEGDGTGDTGPTHHEPAEKKTKPAPGRGPDLSKIAEENFKAANAVADAWDKAYLETLTGIDKQVAAVDLATQKEILKFSETGASWKQMVDFTVATTAEGEAKKTALIKENAEKQQKELALNLDWYRGEQEKLYDELAGASTDYYAKQQAGIDRMIDREKALLDQRLDDGKLEQEQYDELVDKLQLVYDAKTHLLDQEANSIVGFRKRMEEAAAVVVMTTDDITGGLLAGWDTILSHVQSTTESVRDAVVGIWGDITTGIQDGLLALETGTGKIGDVLKSLWDSVLKDFNKMLVQMLERWITTGELMGESQGGGGQGGFAGLFKAFGGGQTGSTGGTGGRVNYGQIDEWGNETPGKYTYGEGGGAGLAGYGSALGAVAGIGYGIYSGVSALTAPRETSRPTYQGQDLGQTADFGHASQTGALVAGAAAAAIGAMMAATVAGTAAIAAVTSAGVAAVVPVVGWVVAAVLLIVAALLAIFSGPEEGHIKIKIADAFDKSNAKTVIGGFLNQIFDTTTNYVGQLAFKAAGPEGVSGYVASYRKYLKEALGTALFDIAAGSPEDLQKDVERLFKDVLPKMAMQAAFGQVGIGQPPGDRDWAGGMAGIDWNTNNALMDSAGNFLKKQLFDPNAPIPLLLAGIGFTQDKIGEIATKLSTATDLKVFEKWLSDLVGLVVDLGALATAFGRTRDEWFATIRGGAAKQGTAAQFEDQAANLKAGGELLATIFGDERVAAGQQLVKDGQALLANEQAALAGIVNFIDQIATQTLDTIRGYRDKLFTPSQREAALRERATEDYAAIATAANPKDVAAAWQKVLSDMTGLLDVIVARIQEIQALQQNYADFRAQMAKDAGPQFGTDPSVWLAMNQKAIDSIDWSDAIAGAKTLLGLEQERYQNLFQMVQRIKDAIAAVNDQVGAAISALSLQAMGSVTTDASGKKTWTPDVHAQGEAMWAQIQALEQQLGVAATPEAANRIWNQITALLGQLASQPQDPEHYAESRRILEKAWADAGALFDAQMLKVQHTLEADLSGIGDKLKAGEEALSKALGDAQWDFEQALHNLGIASDAATLALNGFADDLITQMGLLVTAIGTWIELFTTVPVIKPGGGGGGTWEDDPTDPLWEINTVTGERRRKKPTKVGGDTGALIPGAPAGVPDVRGAAPFNMPPINVTVDVTSGSPEEIAGAVADAVYPAVLESMKVNNRELVRVIRNNPALLSRAS